LTEKKDIWTSCGIQSDCAAQFVPPFSIKVIFLLTQELNVAGTWLMIILKKMKIKVNTA
jgi:hypothetical protein